MFYGKMDANFSVSIDAQNARKVEHWPVSCELSSSACESED